jgi:hypothetical protein
LECEFGARHQFSLIKARIDVPGCDIAQQVEVGMTLLRT